MRFNIRALLSSCSLLAALGGLSNGCAGEAPEAASQGSGSDEVVAGSRCVEPQFSTCLQFNGGSGCAKNCEVSCQGAIKSCLAGGGGAACASRCGSAPSGSCALRVPNTTENIYQICPDLRVTRSELVCMNVLLEKQGLAQTDGNINWAYSNCWIIDNEGFDSAAPGFADVVEEWLKGRGLL